MTGRYKSQALMAFAARAVAMGASFGQSIVIARVMSIENAGRFFTILALMNGAATIGRLGLDNLALREVSAGNLKAMQALRMAVLPCLFFSALSGIGVALLSSLFLGPATADQRITTGVAAALTVPASALAVLNGAIHRAQGRIGTGTIAELGSTSILAIVGLAALSRSNHLVSNAEAWPIYCTAAWLTAIWSTVALQRAQSPDLALEHGPRIPNGTRTQLIFLRDNSRSLLSFMATSLSFYLLTWAPVLVLGAFGSAEQTAYFNVAARVAAFVSIVPSIQSSYLSPAFARLYAMRQLEELGRLASRASLTAGIIGTLVVLPILIAPEAVLSIFGAGYLEARGALTVLALSSLVRVALGPLTPLMMTCRLEVAAGFLTTIAVALSFGVGVLVSGRGADAMALMTATLGVAYSAACFVLVRGLGLQSSFLLPLKGPQGV